MVDMTADDWSILFANFDTIKEKLETTAMSADEFINYLREDVDRRTVEEKRAGADSVGDSEA
jgi:hypothetical protein